MQLNRPDINSAQKCLEQFWRTSQDLAIQWLDSFPSSYPYLVDLLEMVGQLYFEQADLAQAIHYWQQVVACRPQARAWNNLGVAYLRNHQNQEAINAFQQTIRLAPDNGMAYYNLGYLFIQQEKIEESCQYLQKSLNLLPEMTQSVYSLYEILFDVQQFEWAKQLLDICEPFLNYLTIPIHFFYRSRALCAHYLMEIEEVHLYFEKAKLASEHPLQYEFEALTCLPHIYFSVEHIEQVRSDFMARLERFCEDVYTLAHQGPIPFPISLGQSFLLAYHLKNDRDIMQKIAQLWSRVLQVNGQLLELRHVPARAKKIKIGFISQFIHHHSIMICYGHNIVTFGQSNEFETHVFYLGNQWDHYTDFIKEQVDYFYHLEDSSTYLTKIAEQEFDILIYTDIGMNIQSYYLALHRLAPIQCVLPGHPVTTGLPNIDYYFSNALTEPSNAQDHYSEKLVLLPEGISHYQPLELPEPIPRSQLGWDDEKHIYFCPMTLFKIHPTFDEVLAQILSRDPLSEIWFVNSDKGNYARFLYARFRSTIPDFERIKFSPWMYPGQFLQAIQAADICLDPFGFSGGSTARMVLGCGQYLLTLPGEFFRGRVTFNCYRQMKLEELVATSLDDYVNKAIVFVSDPHFRQEVKSKLKEKHHILFEKNHNTHNMMKFIRQAVRRYPELIEYQDGK